MGKNRLEAFSDGVLAIIITIMVLELRAPGGPTLADLWTLAPKFACYLLSFIYVGIYWNNHHHLLHTVRQVSPGILWANLALLFWLSLFPLATAWVSHYLESPTPAAVYGVVLMMAGVSYSILTMAIRSNHGPESVLAKALGRDGKGKLSVLLYAAAVGLAFVEPMISYAIYVGVALMWLIPDRRIERALADHQA